MNSNDLAPFVPMASGPQHLLPFGPSLSSSTSNTTPLGVSTEFSNTVSQKQPHHETQNVSLFESLARWTEATDQLHSQGDSLEPNAVFEPNIATIMQAQFSAVEDFQEPTEAPCGAGTGDGSGGVEQKQHQGGEIEPDLDKECVDYLAKLFGKETKKH